MAMSDCIKCWETPCACGYDYADWSMGRRVTLAMAVLGVSVDELRKISIPTEHPQKGQWDADQAEYNKRQQKMMDEISNRAGLAKGNR